MVGVSADVPWCFAAGQQNRAHAFESRFQALVCRLRVKCAFGLQAQGLAGTQ